jgi:hypothetical protein
LPDGVTVNFDDRDPVSGPVLAEARVLARELGADQRAFSKMLGLQAKLEVARERAEQARVDSEQRAIAGYEGRRRVLNDFLARSLTSTQADALASAITTKQQFEALEQLMRGRAASSIPGDGGRKSLAERMYPHLPTG